MEVRRRTSIVENLFCRDTCFRIRAESQIAIVDAPARGDRGCDRGPNFNGIIDTNDESALFKHASL